MSFADALARQQAAIFARLGEDAGWTGAANPVRVIVRTFDDDAPIGPAAIMAPRCFIKVRRSEIAAAVAGDLVTPAETGGTFKIVGEPAIDRKGVWKCEAMRVA